MKKTNGSVWQTIKNLLKPFLKVFIALSPNCVIEKLVSIRPSLVIYIPENRKFVFQKYLDDISINIDTTYRIEIDVLNGYYDKEALFIVDQFVKSGDTCFDIGANIGPISFMLAKNVRPDGKVFAFEPGGILYERLTDNIKLNPAYAEIIQAYKIGFSDGKKTMAWNEDQKNRGNAGFLLQASNQEEQIEMVKVDDFVEENRIEKVNFMKIDVEGMEYEVIKGSMSTIKACKPILYYETGFFDKGFWAEILRGEQVILFIEQILKEIGYKFYKLENGRLIETHYPDLSYNTLAMAEH